jgi:vacuolar-type H+-ATPase subunit H
MRTLATNVKDQSEGMVYEARRQPDESPLYAIQKKEIELNAETMRVKRQAEEIVAKARKQALDIHEKAERHGAETARSINEREMTKARQQADLIMESEESKIKEIRDRGRGNMDKAVAHIANAVLGRAGVNQG